MSINRQLDVAACLDAHRNFVAQGNTTFCNVYACAFLAMRGHVIPLNMSANELYDWFSSPSAIAKGWRRSTEAETLAVANAGGDAVAIIQGAEHGHIAVCVESLPTTPGVLCVSAAGRSNFVRAPITRSFDHAHPTFFVNLSG